MPVIRESSEDNNNRFVVTDTTIAKDLFGRTAQNVALLLAQDSEAVRKLTQDTEDLKNKASEAAPILKDTMGGAIKSITSVTTIMISTQEFCTSNF